MLKDSDRFVGIFRDVLEGSSAARRQSTECLRPFSFAIDLLGKLTICKVLFASSLDFVTMTSISGLNPSSLISWSKRATTSWRPLKIPWLAECAFVRCANSTMNSPNRVEESRTRALGGDVHFTCRVFPS